MNPPPPDALDELTAARREISRIVGDRTVAIAQEWIGARAGSEKVFEALARLLPDADLFALSNDPECELATDDRSIRTTFLDRPWCRRHRAVTLPMMPLAWRVATRSHYDVVVTSAHTFARNFGRHGEVHLSYVHSPARYVWFPELDAHAVHPVLELAQRPARAVLRTASTWRRPEARIRWPPTPRRRRRGSGTCTDETPESSSPVDTVYYHPTAVPRTNRLLAFGRLIPYKRFDAAIEVAARLRRPLVIAGTGSDEARLRKLAATTPHADVTFVGHVSDDEVRELYRSSAALLFLGVEDFGIIPVEAQACGLPVVGAGAGGTLETVVDGHTGAHATEPSVDAFVAAAERVLGAGDERDACRANAERFGYSAFGRRIAAWLADTLG